MQPFQPSLEPLTNIFYMSCLLILRASIALLQLGHVNVFCCLKTQFAKHAQRQEGSYSKSKKKKKEEEKAKQPLNLNAPLHTVSKARLKQALKEVRQNEKKARRELERIRKKIQTESVSVSKDLHTSMQAILAENKPDDPFAQLFWAEQQKAFKCKGRTGMKWHPMMIRLALLLHSKGSAAYKTLRETGVLKLPGESTLRDYTNYIHPEAGFQLDVVDDIRCAAEKLENNQKYVVLLHDEMSIKEDLVFDNKSEEIVGFVNIQNWTMDASCKNLASHVLVFYVVGVNSALKKSMGFFPTRNARADELYPLFWEAVRLLEQTCQLKVIASVSDKAPPNQRMYQLHGNPGEICYKSLNFHAPETEPDRYIYFFSDPPHLVKTVRNNLFRSGFSTGKTMLLWNNGKHLLWQHVTQLYEADKKRQLRMLRKLRNDHIYLTGRSMMNVRLAAQVLSNSVAVTMNLHGGEEAKETANFISLMNRFFDCLNARSRTEGIETRNDSLLPYSDTNDPRFGFLDEFLAYLEAWKTSVQTRPGTFSAVERSKMFLTHQTYKGLVMTIKSFQEATRYLLNNGVQYVFSNRFSQDPLEAHFGRHRSLCPRSENPNLYRFGYQENAIRQQRTVAMVIQPKGNVEKQKRGRQEIIITNSPVKKARKE